MACEVCGRPTSGDTSDRPTVGADEYYTWVCEDPDNADMVLGIATFEFCSLDHLRAFVPPDS